MNIFKFNDNIFKHSFSSDFFKDQDIILNSPKNYGENVITLRLHPQRGTSHSGKQNEFSQYICFSIYFKGTKKSTVNNRDGV